MVAGSSKARSRLIETVECLQWQVTLGDVASQTGLALSTARQELLSLAQDAGGSLQVSADGDILYVFPKGIRQILAAKAAQDQWAQRRKKLWLFFLKIFRASFGVFLIVEFVLIVTAIILLMSSSSREGGDSRRREGGDSRRHEGGDSRRREGGVSILWIPDIWVGNPFWRDPYAPRRAQAGEMNFLEAVYSFLFGDGDPNADLEAERMRMIGQVIRQHQGVIVADQVLPYLDVPYQGRDPEREDFMVPILLAFDGEPQVSPEGHILYRFPELQISARDEDKEVSLPGWLQERFWKFSQADPGQRTLAITLGIVNFVGAWGLQLFAHEALLQLGGLGALIGNLLWLMVLYGTLFLLVPGVRWFVLQGRNQKIAERNAWRQSWRDRLRKPVGELASKLAALKGLGQRQVVDREKVIYRSDQDLLDQPDPALNHPQWQVLVHDYEEQPH